MSMARRGEPNLRRRFNRKPLKQIKVKLRKQGGRYRQASRGGDDPYERVQNAGAGRRGAKTSMDLYADEYVRNRKPPRKR